MIHATTNIFPNEQQQEDFLNYIDAITLDEDNRKANLEQAKMLSKGYSPSDRRSKVMWIDNKQIRYDVCDYIMKQNVMSLGLDLYPFQCEIQYAEYNADEEGHFDWHSDQDPFLTLKQQGEKPTRKYSATMHLNDYGEDYEGGKFEIFEKEIPDTYYKRGSFILFPSPMLHRVPPVTKGIRRSLVFFLFGPRFK